MSTDEQTRYDQIATECGREAIQRITDAGGEPGDILRAFENMLAAAIMTAAKDGRESELFTMVMLRLAMKIDDCKAIKAQNTTHH